MTADERGFLLRAGIWPEEDPPRSTPPGEETCWRPVLPGGFMPCLKPYGHAGRCSL